MTGAVLTALAAHWRRHPIQWVTLVLGLALATALWSGVQAINSEARRSYAEAAGALGQNPLERLTGPQVTLQDFVDLRRAGWQVSPVIEGPLTGHNLTLRGIDLLSAPRQAGMLGLLDGNIDPGTFLSTPGLLLAAPETLPSLGETGIPAMAVPGIPPGIVYTDIPIAQKLLARTDLDYLTLAPEQPRGLPPLETITRLTRQSGTDASDIAQLTDSFHLNLTAFGLLSFAVGLFIVQSAIGLAFEQRRSTFRTLRALGVGLRHLLLLLAAELTALALLAGTLGLGLGYAIAAALLPGVSGTLRSLYGAEVAGSLNFDPLWALAALAMTLLGAAAAGALALWRVAHLPLLAPAKPRAWARASQRQLNIQRWVAALLFLIAALLAVYGNSLITGFGCLAALLLGAALALPSLLIVLLNRLSHVMHGPLGEWLIADARQQVPALSLALMALLLALAANIGVGTMVGSFRGTFTGWLDQRLAAELYITTRTEEEATEISAYLANHSDAVLPIWSAETTLNGQPAEIFGVVDHMTYRDNWPLIEQTPDTWDRIADGTGLLINEQMARRNDLETGDEILVGADWRLPVVGIYSDYGNPRAEAIAGSDILRPRFPDHPILRFAVRVPAAQAQALKADLQQRFDLPASVIVDQAAVKAASLDVFEQTFRVTGALNVLTLAIAAFAMWTSLLTLSSMRLTQLAPVWALGLAPARLARFEVLRTAILAGLTWLLAVPVGLCLAWVLLSVVNVHAFGWRLPMALFPGDWITLAGWALLAALLAAFWPALQLTRAGALLLRKVADDR